MNRAFIKISFALILISCSVSGPGLPHWLEGNWETGNSSGFTGENWQMINDTLITGKGLANVNGQLLEMEEISIFISKGELYYGARVSEQNDGRQIFFKATFIGEEHLVFENPEHDFPTRIVYKLKDHNTLKINISGRDEEDTRTITLFRK